MDIITQRFIAIGNKFLAELRLLLNGIQQLVGAVHDAEEARHHGPQQQPPVLRAELQIPETIERETAKRDKRHYRVQIWLAFATTLAFIAAAIYAGIAAAQWNTMKKTYGEIKTQTEQVTQQTTLLRRQLVGTQAAVIRLSNDEGRSVVRLWPDIGPQGQLSLLLVNDGHVLAREVTGEISLNRVRIPDGSVIPNSKTSFPINFPIVDIGDIRASTQVVPLFEVSPHDDGLFRDTKIAIRVEIRIQYDDGFGNIIPQSICVYGFDNVVKMNAQSTRGGPGLLSCDLALETILEQKRKYQSEAEVQPK
jgi:hypothetical protein